MKRIAIGALLALALLAAHIVYWYLPRERAVAPRLPVGVGVRAEPSGDGRTSPANVRRPHARPGRSGKRVPQGAAGPAGAGEPLQVLAAGDYDVCLWVPYPHQNLGALATAIGDLGDVIGAAARLTAGGGGEAAQRAQEPEEAPTFGPFEVPPANEMVACSDLAGGQPRRLRVVARIYPVLAVVAKLAGRLAGNPWLAGGEAGPMRIAWSGRLWSVTSGAAGRAAAGDGTPELPESLAVVHWTGARPEIPAGYYTLTRSGSDLAVSLISPGGDAGSALGSGGSIAALSAAAGPLPSLLVAVGPEWRGAVPFGGGEPLPPAALALFETGGSRLSTLGDLPGLAVFNAGPPGVARWHLPTEGIFRLLARRLPTAEVAGWKILALDPGSLRQAEALAPRLAALVPPLPAGAVPVAGVGGAAGAAPPGATSAAQATAGSPQAFASAPDTAAAAGAGSTAAATPRITAGGPALSMGAWLEPRSTLRIVSRIRQFVEKFPLATRRQIELWRDWETVLDPLANCDHAALTATASPASMRLLLQSCTASVPH